MNSKPNLIVLVGAPASGKTTWAKAYAAGWSNTIIVGRDKMREMMFGYSEATVIDHFAADDFKERENTITTYQQLLIREALAAGTDVVVDDTNLNLDRIHKFIRDYDRYIVTVHVVHATREECLERNKGRTRQVDLSTMNKLYDEYLAICEKRLPGHHLPTISVYIADPLKPKTYIVDLDGTIAGHAHRKTYGCTDDEIAADIPIQPVIDVVRLLLGNGCYVQFLSGREDRYEEATWQWLGRQFDDLTNCQLHMRKTGDFRKDSTIKQELFFERIAPNYNVVAAFDDRKQVKHMWVDLGVFVFDVNQSDRWF